MALMQIFEAQMDATAKDFTMNEDAKIVNLVVKDNLPTILYMQGDLTADVTRKFFLIEDTQEIDFNDRFYRYVGSVVIDLSIIHVYEDILNEALA